MKKVPLRKCVATGEQLPKKELIRIVRNKEGEVSVDLTGKKSGRGAYICKSVECLFKISYYIYVQWKTWNQVRIER